MSYCLLTSSSVQRYLRRLQVSIKHILAIGSSAEYLGDHLEVSGKPSKPAARQRRRQRNQQTMAMDTMSTAPLSLLLSIILGTSDQDGDDNGGGYNIIDDGSCTTNDIGSNNNDADESETSPLPQTQTPKLPLPPPSSTPLCHQSLTSAVSCLSTYELLREIQILDNYRRAPPQKQANDECGDINNSNCTNKGDLYRKVRALLFLYAIHRFHLPERRRIRRLRNNSKSMHEEREGCDCEGESSETTETERKSETKTVFCPMGYAALLERRFEDAIDCFLASVKDDALLISPDDHDDMVLEPRTQSNDDGER